MSINRVNYFDHQFLRAGDFIDEQNYHLEMRRRLNRVLHGFGIAEGLGVEKAGSQQITIKPGVAIDRQGNEIIVESDVRVDLSDASAFPANAAVSVSIEHEETLPSAPGTKPTRISDTFKLKIVTAPTPTPTDGSVIPLAKFTMTSGREIPAGLLDGGVRRACGAKLAAGSVEESHLVPALLNRIKDLEARVTTLANDMTALVGRVTSCERALRPTFAPKNIERGEFQPTSEFVNKDVILFGSNLDSDVKVFFGSKKADLVSTAHSQIVAKVPSLPGGTVVNLTLTNVHGSVTSISTFTVKPSSA